MAEIASAQRTLVHLSQLRALGITRGAYHHRIAAGSLHRVLPSVVSVVHPVLEPWAAETAALLYAGDGAVLSHERAAAVWGLAPTPSFVAITQIGRTATKQEGLRLHRVKALDIRDVRVHGGFPVTTPARTLIDCAAGAASTGCSTRPGSWSWSPTRRLTAAMARSPGRKGVGPLRGLLSDEQERGYSRSAAERSLRRLLKDAGLEPPAYNTYALGFQVDAVWPRQRVMVEVDGYGFHGHERRSSATGKRDQR